MVQSVQGTRKTAEYIGREEQLQQMLDLAQPGFDKYIWLTGGRDAGKTFLLKEFGRRLEDKGYCFQLVSLKMFATETEKNLYYEIARLLFERIKGKKPEQLTNMLKGLENAAKFGEFLDHLPPMNFTVIALDDVHELPQPVLIQLIHSLFSYGNTLRQSQPRWLFFVFSGMLLPNDFSSLEHVSSIEDFCEAVSLRDLDFVETCRLIESQLQNGEFSSARLEELQLVIYRLSSGHPQVVKDLVKIAQKSADGRAGIRAETLLEGYRKATQYNEIEHIKTIDHILENNPRLSEKLTSILFSGARPPDFMLFNDAEMLQLYSLGLVKKSKGKCLVHNQVYQAIIGSKLRRQKMGRLMGGTATLLIAILVAFLLFAFHPSEWVDRWTLTWMSYANPLLAMLSGAIVLASLALLLALLVSSAIESVAIKTAYVELVLKGSKSSKLLSYLFGLPSWVPLLLGLIAIGGLLVMYPACRPPLVGFEFFDRSTTIYTGGTIHLPVKESARLQVVAVGEKVGLLTCQWQTAGASVITVEKGQDCNAVITLSPVPATGTLTANVKQALCPVPQQFSITVVTEP